MPEDRDQLMDYAIRHTTSEDDLLHRLYRETNLTTVYPRMLSGHMQGKLLEFISHMIKPQRILEIGTFTGYSAICMARGLAEGGKLHTIDINDELADQALKYFNQAGFGQKIILHTGNACEIIPALEESFDLVFIDGDKEQYLDYYTVSFQKVRVGGFIIADNVLWGGKVMLDKALHDKETAGILQFNTVVSEDTRVEKFLLPFRDGLYILRKISQ